LCTTGSDSSWEEKLHHYSLAASFSNTLILLFQPEVLVIYVILQVSKKWSFSLAPGSSPMSEIRIS
jgi:hypothetical protein